MKRGSEAGGGSEKRDMKSCGRGWGGVVGTCTPSECGGLGAGFPAVSLLALLAPPQPAIDGQPFGLRGAEEVSRC
jgi:hypothetical protein